MSIFDDELVYAAFLKRDVERRMQELDELWSAYPNRRQGLEPFTITSVGTAAPSPAPVTSLDSSAPPATPPSPTHTAPTSIDNTSEPPQPLPARCSTMGLTHDVSAVLTPSPTSSRTSASPTPPLPTPAAASPPTPAQAALRAEEAVFITMPTRCSTYCFSHDNIQSGNTINEAFSFQSTPTRYITNSSHISDGVILCEMDTYAQKNQTSQTSVLLELLPATLNDKETELYILHVEQIESKPKPPWPVICLEAASVKGTLNSQICYRCWLSFSGDWAEQQKSPWPPPIQQHRQSVNVQLRPTPWPSFDFLTSGHLEKALSNSWHIMQLGDLYQGDSMLFYLGTESFQFVVHLLNPLSVVCINSATEIQLVGCCQLNIQFTIYWELFCGLDYGAPCHMFIQYQSHQIVSFQKLKYLQCTSINYGFCELIILSNSSAIEYCKSSHIAVIIEMMTVKWVSQRMHHSVAWLFSLWHSINEYRSYIGPTVKAQHYPAHDPICCRCEQGVRVEYSGRVTYTLHLSQLAIYPNGQLQLLNCVKHHSEATTHEKAQIVDNGSCPAGTQEDHNWEKLLLADTAIKGISEHYEYIVAFQSLVCHHWEIDKVPWQMLFLCYPRRLRAKLQLSNSVYDGAHTHRHVCQCYCHTQILFSGIFVSGKAIWPVMPMPRCLCVAYLPADLAFQFCTWNFADLMKLHVIIIVLRLPTDGKCSSTDGAGVANAIRHDLAKMQVASNWFTSTACQLKHYIYMGCCSSSKESNIKLREQGMHCLQRHEDHTYAFYPWKLHQLSDKVGLTQTKYNDFGVGSITDWPATHVQFILWHYLAATIYTETQVQMTSNYFALCKDCQITYDIYIDWCIFSICVVYTLEIHLLPDTAKYGQSEGLHYVQILVLRQQHLSFWLLMGITYYQQRSLWDPGDSQYFLGGGTSPCCWSVLELRKATMYVVDPMKLGSNVLLLHIIPELLAMLVWGPHSTLHVSMGRRILNLVWCSSKHRLACVTVTLNFQNNVSCSSQWASRLSCMHQEFQIDGLQHHWHTVSLKQGSNYAKPALHLLSIQKYKLQTTKSSTLVQLVLWLLQYYAQVLEDP